MTAFRYMPLGAQDNIIDHIIKIQKQTIRIARNTSGI
jgi:hypothetical protein